MNQAVSYLELLALAFGLGSTVLGGALWWRSIVRERYAAEREISHLKNSFTQMSANLRDVIENLDEYREEVRASSDGLHRSIARVEAFIAVKGNLKNPPITGD